MIRILTILFLTCLPALAGLLDPPPAQPNFKLSASGLTCNVGAGVVVFPNGFTTNIPAGTVALQNNRTNYVVLQMETWTYHALYRMYDSGSILLGTVFVTNNAATATASTGTHSPPESYVETFKNKQSNRIIALNGDSLTDGGGSLYSNYTNFFWRLWCFNTNYASSNYNIPNLTNTTSTYDFAQGGQTAHWGLMQMGRLVNYRAAQPLYASDGICYGPYQAANAQQPIPSYGLYWRMTPDLATVEYGVNGGSYASNYMESIVANLYDLGSARILITSQPRSSDPTLNGIYGDQCFALAKAYGCDVCDTWAYMREAQENGLSVYDPDTVHQNVAGLLIWCQCIRSILNDYVQNPTAIPPKAPQRVFTTGTNLDDRVPESYDLQFVPISTTGLTNQAAITGNSGYNPAVGIGNGTINCMTVLTNGQTWSGSHPFIDGLDLIIQGNSSFTYTITLNASTPVKTNSWTSGATTIQLIEAMTLSDLQGLSQSFGGLYAFSPSPINGENMGYTITCTSGTMQLIGAAYATRTWQELNLTQVQQNGTFGIEGGLYSGGYTHLYSDTIGNTMTIPFTGTGIQLLLVASSSAGKVTVISEDGNLYSAQDLYKSGGAYFLPVNYFPGATTIGIGSSFRANGLHYITVLLQGTNASSIGPNGTHHLLTLEQGRIFTRAYAGSGSTAAGPSPTVALYGTNDPVPGAWNLGPSSKFYLTVPVESSVSTGTAGSQIIMYSNAVGGLVSRASSIQVPGLGTATVTNVLTAGPLNANSMWSLTNDAGVSSGAGAVLVVPSNGTRVTGP